MYIIILLFIIIIIIILFNNNEIEHYDLEILNSSISECGTKCTEGRNCAGFSYKPRQQKCFLSKKPILGRPENSLYKDDYLSFDKRCNKINMFTDKKSIDKRSMTQNSIYTCSDGENNISDEFQFANLGATSLDNNVLSIFDRTDKLIPNEVSYELNDITWPETKTINNSISKIPENTNKKYGFT